MSTLDDWVSQLAAELDVEVDVDVPRLLDLSRDAAHSVERPAAPLTTFLVGYAAALSGGGPAAVDAAIELAGRLAHEWADGRVGARAEPDSNRTSLTR